MSDTYPIDLGKSYDSPGAAPATIESSKDEKHYPCLYLDWDDRYDLPDSGMMTVRFEKRSETNRMDGNGEHQSVELEIQSIEDVVADKKSSKEAAGSALDKYRAEQEAETAEGE